MTFPAEPTGDPGVYLAKVEFPAAGSWSYEVYDGFSLHGQGQTHTFGAIEVGAAGSGSSGFDLPALPLTAGLLALGALVALFSGCGGCARARHLSSSRDDERAGPLRRSCPSPIRSLLTCVSFPFRRAITPSG